jgi:hypothetical protein
MAGPTAARPLTRTASKTSVDAGFSRREVSLKADSTGLETTSGGTDSRGTAIIAAGAQRDRLTPPNRFEISLATAADDAEIRQMLREHPLPGDVTVGLEREPDSHLSAAIEGDVHQTIVARERRTGRLAAIASRSVHNAYMNGEIRRLGYLGQLRIAPAFRAARRLLDAGFTFCRDLHQNGDAPFYLASVIADNRKASRFLLGLRAGNVPSFRPAGRFSTLVIPRVRSRRVSLSGFEIRRGSIDLLEGIAGCLARSGRNHQFARAWTTATLTSPEAVRGLAIEDFVVALRAGAVVGCVARWDQRAFKQAVVRGYSPRLSRWRWLANATSSITGLLKLPPVGTRLDFVYLSHLAIDDDRPDVASSLIAVACRDLTSDVDYVVTGLAADRPLLGALTRRFSHRLYHSDLYTAFWDDGRTAVDALDARLPHPELALL